MAIDGATAADPNAGPHVNDGIGAGAINGAASAGCKTGVDGGGGGVLLAGDAARRHQRVVAAVNFGSKEDANSRGGSAVSSNRGAVHGEGGSATDVREDDVEDSILRRVGLGGGISALRTDSTPGVGGESGGKDETGSNQGTRARGVVAEGSQDETAQLKMALEESQNEV